MSTQRWKILALFLTVIAFHSAHAGVECYQLPSGVGLPAQVDQLQKCVTSLEQKISLAAALIGDMCAALKLNDIDDRNLAQEIEMLRLELHVSSSKLPVGTGSLECDRTIRLLQQ